MTTTLAARSAPSTPIPSPAPTISDNAPPGTWRHPKFDEIVRRTNAATFTDRNVQSITWNAVIFIISFLVPSLDTIKAIHPAVEQYITPLTPYSYYALIILRIFPLLGIVYACSPLIRPIDDLSDIALTPSQRALLGLEPTSRPPTPGSHYITPPRYARSSTPRSSTGSQSGSPFSGNDSTGTARGGLTGAAYSPSASPLFHKAITRDTNRRNSLGASNSSFMGKSWGESSFGQNFNTPSPTNNRGASVSLSSRWLYEKGRGSPGLRNVYS